jgi:hypothetical protein
VGFFDLPLPLLPIAGGCLHPEEGFGGSREGMDRKTAPYIVELELEKKRLLREEGIPRSYEVDGDESAMVL